MSSTNQTQSLTALIGVALALVVSHSAHAQLVLHLPLNDASSGGVTTAAAAINDLTHPTTLGTSTGTGDAWFNDATRGNVYFSNQGSRLTAGTQGIDRTTGFTWSTWVKVDSAAAGNSDAGADVLIGTRAATAGVWNKVQIGSLENWAGITYGPSTLGNNTWRHLTYLGDSTSVRLYIDGALVGTDTTTPTTTFNGPFEIGGSATFTEDSEGLFSDLGVWTEALTANEVKALFDLSNSSPGLLYDVAEFDALKMIHDAGSGSVMIDDVTWTYATGLSGPAGLSGSGNNFTLVLNAAADTGLVGSSAAIPEPASIVLWSLLGLGLFGCAVCRARRNK